MSAANPFAIAVEALQERFERLLDVRRDALHVAEIYSENKAVVEGQAVIAADALERLHVTRAALAVFERLAALANRVERNVLEGEVEHRLPNSVGGIVSAVKWANDEADEICLPDELFGTWIVETESFHYCTPDFAEEDTVLRLLSVLECRRRNEAQP